MTNQKTIFQKMESTILRSEISEFILTNLRGRALAQVDLVHGEHEGHGRQSPPAQGLEGRVPVGVGHGDEALGAPEVLLVQRLEVRPFAGSGEASCLREIRLCRAWPLPNPGEGCGSPCRHGEG